DSRGRIANEHLWIEHCADDQFAAPVRRDRTGRNLAAVIAVDLHEPRVVRAGRGFRLPRVEAQHLGWRAPRGVMTVPQEGKQPRVRGDPHYAVVVHVDVVRRGAEIHALLERQVATRYLSTIDAQSLEQRLAHVQVRAVGTGADAGGTTESLLEHPRMLAIEVDQAASSLAQQELPQSP